MKHMKDLINKTEDAIKFAQPDDGEGMMFFHSASTGILTRAFEYVRDELCFEQSMKNVMNDAIKELETSNG